MIDYHTARTLKLMSGGLHAQKYQSTFAAVCLALAADKQVVVCVGSDPDPDNFLIPLGCESAMVQANSGRPNPSDPLQVQAWVSRILQQHLVAAISQSSRPAASSGAI